MTRAWSALCVWAVLCALIAGGPSCSQEYEAGIHVDTERDAGTAARKSDAGRTSPRPNNGGDGQGTGTVDASISETQGGSGGEAAGNARDASSDSPEQDAGSAGSTSPTNKPDGGSPPDAGPVITPGSNTTVTAFSKTHVYFGKEDRRSISKTVRFPAANLAYKKLTLEFTLGCPNNRCDAWDRRGFLGVVDKNGNTERIIEVLRFMTPYGRGGTWKLDVTGLRPLLTGEIAMRVFIDTWVGPGHEAGDGWLVDAKFAFEGGFANPEPLAVIPLWPEIVVDYGDPARSPTRSTSVTLPADAGKVELRSIITGHGQGNAENCAEFCAKTHGYNFGSKKYERVIWRDDCAQTAVPNQGGTWTLSRAGWCPGAIVNPWLVDVSASAKAGTKLSVQYGVSGYVNTCRPGASPCTGCTLGTGCNYDGGNHTPPIYIMSALLIVYRR